MAEIMLNGQPVALTVQPQEQLGLLGQSLIPLIDAGHEIAASLAGIVVEALRQGLATTDPKVQAPLWLLHEMGVRELTAPAEGHGSIDRILSAEERARDTSDPYSPGNMATGRALATALHNVATRMCSLNGEERRVRLFPQDKVVPAIQAVIDMRRLNEPIHITTTRAIATLLVSGTPPQDERIEVLLGLASDLGVVALSVDGATSTITFESEFSEANAVASAYLQGGGVQGVQGARQRIRYLNSQMRGAATAAVPQGGAAAGASSGLGGARPTPRNFVRPRRRR